VPPQSSQKTSQISSHDIRRPAPHPPSPARVDKERTVLPIDSAPGAPLYAPLTLRLSGMLLNATQSACSKLWLTDVSADSSLNGFPWTLAGPFLSQGPSREILPRLFPSFFPRSILNARRREFRFVCQRGETFTCALSCSQEPRQQTFFRITLRSCCVLPPLLAMWWFIA